LHQTQMIKGVLAFGYLG